ncbi:MAG: sulfotransferase [Pseudomonadales bacterium]|nr:sulfotransferase [Pseudomonadales bacterium]
MSPSTSKDLQDIQADIAAGNLPAAFAALARALEREPENEDVLYLLAVCNRYAGQHERALEILRTLKTLSPNHSRGHQEEGHVYRDQGAHESALLAYERALKINPVLRACLTSQLQILTSQRRERQAIFVVGQIEKLDATPKELLVVTDLIAQGRIRRAENLCRRFLTTNPKHVEGMRLLADIGSRLGVLDDADFLLESARGFAPDNIQIQMDYIQVLRKRQHFAKALAEAESLLERDPDNPQFMSLYAIESMQAGDYEQAIVLLNQVLEKVPGDPVTLTTKGHALKTRGESGKAVAAYQEAIVSQPAHGEAYYSLANLKTYQFSDNELSRMQAQEQNLNLSYMERVYLCFALAKAYEDRHAYADAFAYYAQGNVLKKAESRYDAEAMQKEFAATQAVCGRELFARHATNGDPSPDPIFVLGLPRAGSTLLEQILSSHSRVDGTLELPNILSLSQRLRRRKDGDSYPGILTDLLPEELAAYGLEYIEQTRIHRQEAPFFVDKMPNNFRHIGLIKLILPNAKVIDARREPMSCCFSGFKQLFAEGQEFTYSLADIGRYYADYVALMAHWDDVLPGFVLRVQHEDVVADLETEVRRILDFCGLDFEESCLNYFETERNIRTPSSEQVRQPIFSDGIEQWRHFEPWLGPLKAALGERAVV